MAMAFGVHHAWVASVPIPPALRTPKLNPPFPPVSASFSRRPRISTLRVCSATSKKDDPSSDPSAMAWVGGSEGADHHRAQGVHINPQEVCQFLGLNLIERILEREIPSCQPRNWQVFCRLLLNNAHVSGRYLGQVFPILCSHPVKRSRELSSGSSGLKLLKHC